MSLSTESEIGLIPHYYRVTASRDAGRLEVGRKSSSASRRKPDPHRILRVSSLAYQLDSDNEKTRTTIAGNPGLFQSGVLLNQVYFVP
ncbi:hypothetical protein KDL29_15490 [bacterium]|nr:hypothetical protein [bacterium]